MPVFNRGTHTETLGTAIVECIPPYLDMIPRITALYYTAAGTAHTGYILRAIGDTTVINEAKTGQAVIDIANTSPGKTVADPAAEEVLASADYVAYMTRAGACEWNTVSSVSAEAVTMTNNVGAVVAAGAKFWVFHEVARATHISFALPASPTPATNYAMLAQAGYPTQLGIGSSRTGVGDPLIFVSNNITAAGSLNYLGGHYEEAGEIQVG